MFAGGPGGGGGGVGLTGAAGPMPMPGCMMPGGAPPAEPPWPAGKMHGLAKIGEKEGK